MERFKHLRHLIGIVGRTVDSQREAVGSIGAGKNAFADALASSLWESEYRMAFADPIKSILIEALDFTEEQLHTQEGKSTIDPRYGKTPREAMLTLGVAWGRGYHEDIWCDHLLRRLESLLLTGKSVIVSDVRLTNEFECLKRAGARMVLVERLLPNAIKLKHPSEDELLQLPRTSFDVIVPNDSTLTALQERAQEVLPLLEPAPVVD